ncbi:hypothetical protein BC826DRAFT_1020176, partial [Russula brevipes]
MQRLVYRPSDVAWDAITSHLSSFSAARTLDDILVIVRSPKRSQSGRAAPTRRVLDVLAQQVMLDGTASSTSMELRRLCLEALHQILPGTPSSS